MFPLREQIDSENPTSLKWCNTFALNIRMILSCFLFNLSVNVSMGKIFTIGNALLIFSQTELYFTKVLYPEGDLFLSY